MTNTNITNFRKDIYELLEQTIKYNEPINISTKNGNAIGLSDIGFMSYLNYLNITISMLYSFDLISKNEYDYLLKYISNVDWDILCKKEV